jgi:hypothetical protein
MSARISASRHRDASVRRPGGHAGRDGERVDRFTDGGEFRFGTEIGISIQKRHARRPMSLPELASTKYVVSGDGHLRG